MSTFPVPKLRRVEFSDFRKDPMDAFDLAAFMEGIGTHRWERYVVPEGKTPEDLPRGIFWRLLWEVPGDGNVYDHQLHQERLIRTYAPLDEGSPSVVTAGYVRGRPLDRRDVFVLRVCALVHDLAEIEHGDHVTDAKHLAKHTVADEIRSTRAFVRRALLESDPRRARRFERTTMRAYSVDYEKNHRLHPLFKLYEKYSYLEGAVSAYERGQEVVANAVWLVHNVFKNQIVALVAAARAGVPSAGAILRERASVIDEMFRWVAGSGHRDTDENEAAFVRAKHAWADFRNGLPGA